MHLFVHSFNLNWNILGTVLLILFFRQRKLEEALLFSGQFKDAVQALIDWLEKSKKILSENQLLHGDLDTVMALVDQHKVFIITFHMKI